MSETPYVPEPTPPPAPQPGAAGALPAGTVPTTPRAAQLPASADAAAGPSATALARAYARQEAERLLAGGQSLERDQLLGAVQRWGAQHPELRQRLRDELEAAFWDTQVVDLGALAGSRHAHLTPFVAVFPETAAGREASTPPAARAVSLAPATLPLAPAVAPEAPAIVPAAPDAAAAPVGPRIGLTAEELRARLPVFKFDAWRERVGPRRYKPFTQLSREDLDYAIGERARQRDFLDDRLAVMVRVRDALPAGQTVGQRFTPEQLQSLAVVALHERGRIALTANQLTRVRLALPA